MFSSYDFKISFFSIVRIKLWSSSFLFFFSAWYYHSHAVKYQDDYVQEEKAETFAVIEIKKKRNVVESHVVWFLKRDLTRILMEICSYRFYLWQSCRVIIDFLCMVYALFTCRKYWRMIYIMPGISCKHCSRNSWHQKNAMKDWRRSHVGEHNLLHNTQLAVGHCG